MSDPDFKCYDADDPRFSYDKLDPGIREVVRWLHSLGYETTDSGDGKFKSTQGWDENEIFPYPHVYIRCSDEDSPILVCHDLLVDVQGLGLDVVQAWTEPGKPHIECIYDPVTQIAIIGLFSVTSDMIPGTR